MLVRLVVLKNISAEYLLVPIGNANFNHNLSLNLSPMNILSLPSSHSLSLAVGTRAGGVQSD